MSSIEWLILLAIFAIVVIILAMTNGTVDQLSDRVLDLENQLRNLRNDVYRKE